MSGEGLSQELIDNLLNGSLNDEDAGTQNSSEHNSDVIGLTDEEKDLLGEVGNISMGAAATSISDMLRRRVTITTPIISNTTLKKRRAIKLQIKIVSRLLCFIWSSISIFLSMVSVLIYC